VNRFEMFFVRAVARRRTGGLLEWDGRPLLRRRARPKPIRLPAAASGAPPLQQGRPVFSPIVTALVMARPMALSVTLSCPLAPRHASQWATHALML
jgi:hypothetical protein